MRVFKDNVLTAIGGVFWVLATFSYLVAGVWAFYAWRQLASSKAFVSWEHVVFWLATALTLTALERLTDWLKIRNHKKL